MSKSYFGVFHQSDSSSDEDAESRHPSASAVPVSNPRINIPSDEDLSTFRLDEETVLEAVYANDFQRHNGAWGYARLEVNVRPPDVLPHQIGSRLRYVVPAS
jgi:hypothetical protein